MFMYFVAFNILEASLPSLVSRQASANNKGTAMGIYSTGQFLGIFAGGSLAGIIYQWSDNHVIFITNAIIGSIWFIIACFMKPNESLSSLIIPCNIAYSEKDKVIELLLKTKGIQEVAFSQEEKILYLKVDEKLYELGNAEKILEQIC